MLSQIHPVSKQTNRFFQHSYPLAFLFDCTVLHPFQALRHETTVVIDLLLCLTHHSSWNQVLHNFSLTFISFSPRHSYCCHLAQLHMKEVISKYLSDDGIWTPVILSSDRCARRHCLFFSVLYHFCLHSLCDLC